MKTNHLIQLIRSDLYRYGGNTSLFAGLRHFFFTPGFTYTFWLRICAAFKKKKLLKWTIFPITRLILWHYNRKFGISIPYYTQIESGLYISHFGCIIVNHNAVIGKNLNLSQEVTIGQSNRGKKKGCPTIGDNVYIGPGAKIFGNIRIGNNVAIGANAVVTEDVPDNAVVVGIPAKVISYNGSDGYVNFTDY